MFEVQTVLFGITFESVFPKSVPYQKSGAITVAENIIQRLNARNIKPTRSQLFKRDELFDYELGITMYGENGNVSLNANRFRVAFVNGQTQTDLTAIITSLIEFYGSVSLPEETITTVTIFAHSAFQTVAKRDDFFAAISIGDQKVPLSGIIGYFKLEGWQEEIRLQIDKSYGYPSALFLTWTTTFKNQPVTSELAGGLKLAAEGACEQCGIKFGELKTL
jgi:hypothetical protein